MFDSLIHLLLSSSLMMLLILLVGLSIKSTRHVRYWPMVAFLFCLGVQLLQALLSMGDFYQDYPYLMHTGTWLLFANGPTCWWMLVVNNKKKILSWWHLLPCFVAFLWLTTFYQLDANLKPVVYYGGGINKMLFWLLFLMHWTVYLLAAIVTRKKQNNRNKALYRLVLSLSYSYLFSSFVTWLWLILGFGYLFYFDMFSLLSLALLVLGMTLLHISKTGHVIETAQTQLRFQNDMAERLQMLIVEPQLYRNTALSLNQVAKVMGCSSRVLSTWFNSELKTGFKSWLNEQRINDAKKLIKKQPQSQVSTIGYEVGFNSAATFYRVFKQMAGISPGKYKKNNSNEERVIQK